MGFSQNVRSGTGIAALIIGLIGAFGEATLLFHELAHCLPYKVVEAEAYASFGTTGLAVVPLVSLVIGIWLKGRHAWLSAILLPFLAPMLFAILFFVLSWAYGLIDPAGTDAGGDFTYSAAAKQFYQYSLYLAGIGGLIGAFIALVLGKLLKHPELR